MTELQPGDRIIALASCANGVALLVGAVASGITAWLAKHRLSVAALAVFGGAILGLIIGMVLSRILFPATQGNVVVVKVGTASLPQTFKAALGAAVPASILASILCALVLHAPIMQGVWPAVVTGSIIGICWALLASLT